MVVKAWIRRMSEGGGEAGRGAEESPPSRWPVGILRRSGARAARRMLHVKYRSVPPEPASQSSPHPTQTQPDNEDTVSCFCSIASQALHKNVHCALHDVERKSSGVSVKRVKTYVYQRYWSSLPAPPAQVPTHHPRAAPSALAAADQLLSRIPVALPQLINRPVNDICGRLGVSGWVAGGGGGSFARAATRVTRVRWSVGPNRWEVLEAPRSRPDSAVCPCAAMLRSPGSGGTVGLPLPPPQHARLSLFDSCHRKIRLIGGGPVAFLGGLVA
ncbi:unnamed protein product [Chilo suppressalis]|uniref:Uncharacterized protein n=1 Tax=Chilo suppressalis TaxID=168631 RepID=A0ABN8ATN5_CHISP|nr:unnamed protein product [Chilo suppressalis]